jgi:hypothetical protein
MAWSYVCKNILCLALLMKFMAAPVQCSDSFLCIMYTSMDMHYVNPLSIPFKRSQDSVVGIATSYRLDD